MMVEQAMHESPLSQRLEQLQPRAGSAVCHAFDNHPTLAPFESLSLQRCVLSIASVWSALQLQAWLWCYQSSVDFAQAALEESKLG